MDDVRGRKIFRVHPAYFRKHYCRFFLLVAMTLGPIAMVSVFWNYAIRRALLFGWPDLSSNISEWPSQLITVLLERPFPFVLSPAIVSVEIGVTLLVYWWLLTRTESLTLRTMTLTLYTGFRRRDVFMLYGLPLVGTILIAASVWIGTSPYYLSVLFLPFGFLFGGHVLNLMLRIVPDLPDGFRERASPLRGVIHSIQLDEVAGVVVDQGFGRGRRFLFPYGELQIRIAGGGQAPIHVKVMPRPAKLADQIETSADVAVNLKNLLIARQEREANVDQGLLEGDLLLGDSAVDEVIAQ